LNQIEMERLKRENEALKRKLAEEEAKRAEETAMVAIWGRSRTRGMRMELGAEGALGEGYGSDDGDGQSHFFVGGCK
jgi:hypothetical protein